VAEKERLIRDILWDDCENDDPPKIQTEIIKIAQGFHVQGMSSERLPDGRYTWSLTTAFAKLLRDAQDAYGPRDRSFNFIGFHFCGPYACLERYKWGSPGDIIIVLPEGACFNLDKACFNLAHEVIHFLSPSIGTPVTVFEEGLATVFMNTQSRRNNWFYYHKENDGPYGAAAFLVQSVLDKYPMAVSDLRQSKPRFSDWIADDLANLVGTNTISYDEIEQLCQPFNEWKKKFLPLTPSDWLLGN